ncbi:MAG: hypothetical protein ACRDJO_10275, partial [Actinomycetota bacterium]
TVEARPPTPEAAEAGRRGRLRPVLAVVFAVSLGLFLYGWYLSRERPGVSGIPEGYYKGVDQSAYLHEANDLADANLPDAPEEYPYGLGYPALAVPAILAGFDTDPFVMPNALMWAACVTLVVAIGARIRTIGFGLAAGALLALASPLLGQMVYPWNNSVTVFAVAVAMAAAISTRAPTWRTGLAVGLAAALALAARYVDVAFPLAIVGFAALRDLRRWLVPLAVAGTVVVVAAVVVGITHDRVFGGFLTTPYALHRDDAGSDQALSAFRLEQAPGAGLAIFGTGSAGGKRMDAEPLLRLMPWAVLAPVGLLVAARRRDPLFWPLLGAAVTSGIGTILYLSFRGGAAASLPLGGLRYYGPWFAVWALLTAYAGAAFLDWAGGRSIPSV